LFQNGPTQSSDNKGRAAAVMEILPASQKELFFRSSDHPGTVNELFISHFAGKRFEFNRCLIQLILVYAGEDFRMCDFSPGIVNTSKI